MKTYIALALIAGLPFYATAADGPAGKPTAAPMAHADMDKQMAGMQKQMMQHDQMAASPPAR